MASKSSTFKTTWGDWAAYAYGQLFNAGFPFVWWEQPHWHTSSMGDKRGDVVFITGGNSGTGYETARAYYEHGATVYIGCRSAERARAAIAEIKKGATRDVHGNITYKPADASKAGTIEYVLIDLADLDSVERCAEELKSKLKQLNVLYTNAGIMATDPGQFTAQGYSLQFGTNTLGHQRLVALLLPLLQKTSKANPERPARLVSLSSAAHGFAPSGGIDYSSLKKDGKELSKWAAYGQSKFGDIMIAKYVHNHYGPGSRGAADGEVIAFSVHPGIIATNLGNHLESMGAMRRFSFLTPLWQAAPYTGALNQLWCGEMPTALARKLSGSYVAPFQKPVAPRPDALDPAAADRMWEFCWAETYKRK